MTRKAERVRVDLVSVVSELVLEDPAVCVSAFDLRCVAGRVGGLAGHAVRTLDAVPATARDLVQADTVAVITEKKYCHIGLIKYMVLTVFF